MKKRLVILIYIIIVYTVCLTGCAAPRYDGQELMETAAAKHTALESAHITVTDNMSGEVVQEITYRFAGDVMQYMYMGFDSGTGRTYYEFNNGTELNYMTLPEDTGWSFATKGSEGFYSYSRSARHYFADGSQLLNDYEGAVSASVTEETPDGGKTLTLKYDVDKLSQYAALASYGRFTDFSVRAVFDPDGLCVGYSMDFSAEGGAESGYTMSIEQRDPQAAIERTDIPQENIDAGEQ